MSPKPSVLAELARRDYRFRVIRIENAARASAAIAALNQHSSFDDVLCRYGLPPSQAEGISGAPWTAGSTLPAARLAALGALAPGEYTRTPIWEAGRFLVLRLEATRAAVR
jgi:hypothetical protein